MIAGLVLPLLLASAAASDGPSIEPAKLELAEQVLVASGNDGRVTSLQKSQDVREVLRAALMKEAPSASPEAVDKAVDAELAYERQAFFEENRKLYATRFTIAELNDMLAFYRSPGGKALVGQTPHIIAEKAEFGRTLGQGCPIDC
jgi:hypothetical protein